MSNRDLKLLNELTDIVEIIIPQMTEQLKSDGYENIDFNHLEHPLDKEVVSQLEELKGNIRDADDDYHIFNFIETIKEMWKDIIGKSVKCQRFFDIREPYLEHPEKHPMEKSKSKL